MEYLISMTRSESDNLDYNQNDIEEKWQRKWQESQLHKVHDDEESPNWLEMTMWPYTSGDLHIGHWYAMAPSDAHARFKKMQGYNVLHPMGFDAFGLPAENAAIKRGIHPYEWTMSNIENMRKQLRRMGTIYDWDREVVTCQSDYYRWNQWIFLKFLENNLAYQAHAPANWCPTCNTVLANEQVVNGKCERCSSEVSQRDLNQWFFRITNYAEELLDQSQIDWPNKINIMQTNWIGKSYGTHVQFDIDSLGLETKKIDTFTTRVDTIYGVTFIVISPEHPLVEQLTIPEHKDEVDQYVSNARKQSEIERLSTEKEKTGVFTGAYCLNPLTNEQTPVFVGDYVLLSYGTGIVMGVPAHDERDFKFAKKYNLDIRTVIKSNKENESDPDKAYAGDGILVNSGPYNGLTSNDAIDKISEYLKTQGLGEKSVQYRMRDWLISRQRYWGTPIPIIYCDDCGAVPVPEKDLPVLLPDDAEFKPTGESPLELHEQFVNTECPVCKNSGRRETDTMDTFVDSSWYFLRYSSPQYLDGPFDPVAIKKWQPVDQYTGGAEHAVMHLLYSRFFTKALRDIGLLDFDEPFIRLFNQGHITHSGARMSKSRGNVVSPDDYVKQVGADAVRCYLMFLGPWDQGGDWIDTGINGISRWLNRIWYLCTRDSNSIDSSNVIEDKNSELNRLTHQTLKKVTEDLEKFKFNTTIATLMEFTNKLNDIWREQQVDQNLWQITIRKLLLMIAPLAPHTTEELWEINGLKYSIHSQHWPEWDPEHVKEEEINLVVQVNGKVRDTILVSAEITEDTAKQAAMSSNKIELHIQGKEVKKTIYVPGKLINIVAI